MVAIAITANERRKPNETALEILDMAAKRSEIRGADAEFDDAAQPGEPFGDLVTEAFFPAYSASADEDGENWYDLVYTPFRQRYNLC
jgi:hypothetical protein